MWSTLALWLITLLNLPDLDATLKWHKRLAYVGENGLHILQRKGDFRKDSISKVLFCENCTLGKQYKLYFNTAKYRTTSILEYNVIYEDLHPLSLKEEIYILL